MFFNYTPNIRIDLEQTRGADLGDVTRLTQVPKDRIHCEQPSLFFRVPAELESNATALKTTFSATLAEAFPGFKVFLAAWHIGNLSLVTAFHMQDPRTRELLEATLKSGVLASAFAFMGNPQVEKTPKVNVLIHEVEIDLGRAMQLGRKTEGIVSADQWMNLTKHLMFKGLKTLGVDEAQRKGGTVYFYNVVPLDGWTDLHRDYGLVRES